VARAFDSDNIDVNHYLGLLEFQRNNFEKAQAHFLNALRIDGGYLPSMRALGYAFFKMGRAKEALTYIRKALDIAPNDKESLFTLAESYSEADQK
jgi:Tfp pilus assembly protein PilF